MTRSFDIFFNLRLNKWLSKQWWGWWLETLSCPLWRHCNGFLWFVARPSLFRSVTLAVSFCPSHLSVSLPTLLTIRNPFRVPAYKRKLNSKSIANVKITVSLFLTHWKYCSFALNHKNMLKSMSTSPSAPSLSVCLCLCPCVSLRPITYGHVLTKYPPMIYDRKHFAKIGRSSDLFLKSHMFHSISQSPQLLPVKSIKWSGAVTMKYGFCFCCGVTVVNFPYPSTSFLHWHQGNPVAPVTGNKP